MARRGKSRRGPAKADGICKYCVTDQALVSLAGNCRDLKKALLYYDTEFAISLG
jgi:hypothetical protein